MSFTQRPGSSKVQKAAPAEPISAAAGSPGPARRSLPTSPARSGVAIAALTFVLAACASPERPVTTAVQPLPAPFYTAPAVGLAPEDWWARRLQDPALARLVAAALANAPDLAAAAARIDQARAALRASEAERRPALDAAASVTYNRTASEQFGFQSGGGAGGNQGPQIETDRILYRAELAGSWDADLFGRLAADQRAAAARIDAATFDAAAVRLALVTDVARNYVAARAAAAREAVALDNVESARGTVSVTGARARAGIAPGIDRIRAEALVAETAAAVPPLQAERSARIAALSALTGLAPAELAALTPPTAATSGIDLPAAGVPSDLLFRRPDIAAALANVAAADQDTAAAIAARYPRLSITGTIGLVASALTRLFTGDALSIVAGPSIAAPLFDGGRNRARVEQSRARAAEAVATYRGVVLRAFSEVEESLATVDARRRQRLAVQRQFAAAREAVEVARIQYRTGLTDFLGVLDAERSLNRVRDQLAAVEGEAADAEIAVFRAIGGDYAMERAPIAPAG